MVFQITQDVDDPRTLTQAALQITTLLDMFQPEPAWVLQVNCGNIGKLASGRQVIEPGTSSWEQALFLCVSTGDFTGVCKERV